MKIQLLILLFISFHSFGQDQTVNAKLNEDSLTLKDSVNLSGGILEVPKFLFEKLNLQSDSLINITSSKIWVNFMLYEDGSMHELTILNVSSEHLKNEIARIVTIMPKWIPLDNEGNPAKIKYTLPINICLR